MSPNLVPGVKEGCVIICDGVKFYKMSRLMSLPGEPLLRVHLRFVHLELTGSSPWMSKLSMDGTAGSPFRSLYSCKALLGTGCIQSRKFRPC